MTDTTPHRPLPANPPRQYRRRFASLRTIGALMLREMSTTYGRSPGGYIWAILEPVAGILLLSVLFSIFIASPPLGTSFPLFYATGIVPLTIFLAISGVTAQAINFSKPLLAYPSVTWIDALLARLVLAFLTQLMVAYVIFVGLVVLFGARAILDLPAIMLSLVLTAFLAMGVGTMNCFLFTYFPIWQRGWSILTRPLFLLSGVLMLPDSVPQPWRDWIWYNPLLHAIGLMRRGFYVTYDAPYVSLLYTTAVSGILLLAGLIFMARYHRDLINL